MSLLDLTPEIESLFRTGPLDTGTIVDVFLDDETLHFSDMFHSVTIDDGSGDGIGAASYIPMATRLKNPDDVNETDSLDDQSDNIYLDSSRITDSTDPVGALIDKTIVQRRIRIRDVLFQPDTARTVPLYIFNVRDGIIDGVDDNIRMGDESLLKLRISNGAFAFNERNLWTYSHEDQQKLYPGDDGFLYLAQLLDVKLPWRGEF